MPDAAPTSNFQVETDFQYDVGNCFFDAVAYCFGQHGWPGDGYTIRDMVLQAVRDGTPEACVAVQFWWELRDLHEYRFIRNFEPPLCSEQYTALAAKMEKPRYYWGDDFAISTLANKLRVRIVVIRDGTPAITHPANVTPTHSIVLALNNEHYVPISYRGDCVFSTGRRPRYSLPPQPGNGQNPGRHGADAHACAGAAPPAAPKAERGDAHQQDSAEDAV